MRMRMLRAGLPVVVLALALAATAMAGGPPPASRTDKCPVCGMFVYKYLDWTATAILADGTARYFDGAKDMFRYVLDPGRYEPGATREEPGATREEIVKIYVMDYYLLEPIDARNASYVLGSDVMGPMGRELIPFAGEAAAREFMADHKGKRLLRFWDVTLETLAGLDE